MTLTLAAVLVVIALLGGLCITSIGPGGIFVTIALFLLLDLDPGTVAGTASLTFIGTGLVGAAAYLRSGHLTGRRVQRAALVLSLASIAGAFAGARLNTILDSRLFGLLLGVFVLGIGLVLLVRQRRGAAAREDFDLSGRRADLAMLAVGLGVGLPGGLLGVGGPVLAVPVMVVMGVPMLTAVALAQVQSIFIAAFATTGYALQGAVDLRLAALVGIPLLAGTAAGWHVARRIDPKRLQLALALVLVGLGLYMLGGGGAAP